MFPSTVIDQKLTEPFLENISSNELLDVCGEARPEVRKLRRIKRFIKGLAIVLFLALLTVHLCGAGLYTVYESDCFHRQFALSFQCTNFTLFQYPIHIVTIWVWLGFFNFVLCLLAVQYSSNFQSYLVIFKKMLKTPRFWTFLFQLLCSVALNIMYLSKQETTWRTAVVGYILRDTALFWVVAFWNFSLEPPRGVLWRLYRVTLFVLLIESVILFFIITAQTAVKAVGDYLFIYHSQKLVVLLLSGIHATFAHTFAKFFLYRCFGDKKNLLVKSVI